VFDLALAGASDAHVGELTSSATQAIIGTWSLAIGFQGNGVPGRTTLYIKVRFCANTRAIDLSAKRLQAYVRLVDAPGSPALTTGQGHLIAIFSGPTMIGAGGDFSVDPATGGGTAPGSWYFVDRAISPTEFPGGDAVTHIGFRFIVDSPWTGTIYVDDIRIVPL
jgi:hypothetical protein